MGKVTYLFGAGASASVLPIVKNIPARLEDFFHFIINNRNASNETFKDLGVEVSEVAAEEQLIQQCQDLIKSVKEHESIDTYAKKLRITGTSHKYKALKSILSAFFIYEQIRKDVDKRYDSFFASILESKFKTLGDIRILSWNYDFQFEKAYSAYSEEKSLSANQAILKVFPSALENYDYQDGFGIFKINGTTGYVDKSGNYNLNLLDTLVNYDEKILVRKIVWLYVAGVHAEGKIQPLLSFAWESKFDGPTKNTIDLACSAIKNTETLVIIGYSIPFFNRDVDRKLLRSMSSVKKIYVQDIDPNAVIDKLTSIIPESWDVNPIPINYTHQFYLPPEL